VRVYINLDTNEFVVSPVLTQRVSTLYFVRRDTVPVEVQFVRQGSVVELGAGATGVIGLKTTFAGSFLATDSAWTKTGTGATTIYTFDLNLNTSAMDAQFSPDNDTASINAKIEVSWTVSSTTSSTLPTTATVYNDVIRGGEGVPTTTAAAFALLQAPGGTIYRLSVDNDGVVTTVPN
jgi:hypothetical protein